LISFEIMKVFIHQKLVIDDEQDEIVEGKGG
jgi:hypothetical protein